MSGIKKDLATVQGWWNRFWFAPSSTAPVALLRIAFGTVVTLWVLTALGADRLYYGPEGLTPEQPSSAGVFAFLGWFDSPTAPRVVLIALLVAAVCLTVGLCSRLAGWIVFFGILALHQRNPYVLNGGDLVLRITAFYVALAPTGAALSVDRWMRRREHFWESPSHAPWATRLLQLQIAVMYFDSVWEKVPGDTWRSGTAVAWSLANDNLSRAPGGDFLVGHQVLTNVLTYGTLIVEISMALLVWNRRLRPWVLAGGVLLHVGIEVGMPLGYFPAVVLAAYVVFVTPERGDRIVAGLHRSVRARSLRPLVARPGQPSLPLRPKPVPAEA